MARAGILEVLYSREKSPLEFNYDNLVAPSLLQFMSPYDIQELNNIATSIRYSGDIRKKKNAIRDVMRKRNFETLGVGTNRMAFKQLEYPGLVAKVAMTRVGIDDNPSEYKNQFYIAPFCTKVFEVSPCGTVGGFERISPLTSKEEFASMAGDIFDMLTTKIIGKYIVADVGTLYFMNYGIREGFGACLLDFSYVYPIDGAKLYCTNEIIFGSGHKCGGVIDYDDGFNNLVCTKCGKHYKAKELRKDSGASIKIIKEGDDIPMRVRVMQGEKVVSENNLETDAIDLSQLKQPRVRRSHTLVSAEAFPHDEEIITVKVVSKPTDKPKHYRQKQITATFGPDEKKQPEQQTGSPIRVKLDLSDEIVIEDPNPLHVTVHHIGDAEREEVLAEIESITSRDPEEEPQVTEQPEFEVKVDYQDEQPMTDGPEFSEDEEDHIAENFDLNPVPGIEESEEESEDNGGPEADDDGSGDSLLAAYGLSESDFNEPTEDSAEDSEEASYDEYEEVPHHQKIRRGSNKKFDNF